MPKMIALCDFFYSPDGFAVVEIKEDETFECRDDLIMGLLTCGYIEHAEEPQEQPGAEPLEPEEEQGESAAAEVPAEVETAPEAPQAAPEQAQEAAPEEAPAAEANPAATEGEAAKKKKG